MLAFVVFALSFAAVLQIMASSMRSVTRASDDTEVALLAQSLMETVGTEIPIEEGSYNGNSMGRYDWQLDIFFYASVEGDENAALTQEIAEMSGVELYTIDLNIGWQAGQNQVQKHFSTVRSVLANRR